MVWWMASAVAGTLAVDGTCGNVVSIDATGMTPGGQVAILSAREPGISLLSGGPCAGTVLELDASWTPRGLFTADGAGAVRLAPLLPSPAGCGLVIQAVDAVSCAPTDTATVLAPPLDGYGVIGGQCGVLDATVWSSPDPDLFENDVDFGLEPFDMYSLSPEGLEVMLEGNLGGSSLESEAIAMDVLARCEDAALLKTESEILYLDAGGKKTDLLVEIDDVVVGVSVFRALTFVSIDNRCGTPGQALTDNVVEKLDDILLSAANADPADAWERSALSVIACDQAHADHVRGVWEGLDAATRDRTLILTTVTHGEDTFLYD